MKLLVSTLLLLLPIAGVAQSEDLAIRTTLNNYLLGSSYSDPSQIQSAFYDEAELFLSKEGQAIWVLSPKEYAALFEQREQGVFNGREGKILAIDIANDIATARAEIRIPSRNLHLVDLFLLKKLDGEWKIISKAATQIPKE